MPLAGSPNVLKAELARGSVQIRVRGSLASPLVVEILAGAGFDWLLVDREHAPSDLPEVVAQLQVAAAYPTGAVVRPPNADPTVVRRALECGLIRDRRDARHVG
jgi:4-hydroxy-2-oxoheptanedioate aldolase